VTLAAIVLAAGAGSRFGGDKLSAQFKGEPLIAHAIRAARAAPVSRVIVVCPPALDIGNGRATPVTALRIASKELSASLKAGIVDVADCDGAFIFLSDMPLIPRQSLAISPQRWLTRLQCRVAKYRASVLPALAPFRDCRSLRR
jgi:molybdenum cofactor cytidylyltransferase